MSDFKTEEQEWIEANASDPATEAEFLRERLRIAIERAEAAEAQVDQIEGYMHQAIWALEPFASLAAHHAAEAPEWRPFDSVPAQVLIMYLRDASTTFSELKGEIDGHD